MRKYASILRASQGNLVTRDWMRAIFATHIVYTISPLVRNCAFDIKKKIPAEAFGTFEGHLKVDFLDVTNHPLRSYMKLPKSTRVRMQSCSMEAMCMNYIMWKNVRLNVP